MAWLNQAIGNGTSYVVQMVEGRYDQNLQMATVEVGISFGVLASAIILLSVSIYANACTRVMHEASMKEMCRAEDPASPPTDDCASGCELSVHDGSLLNSEGAYRSDSDADDEDTDVRITKNVQKRSRAEGSV